MLVTVAFGFGCGPQVLGPEEQRKEDPISARAPTPVAPERQSQLVGTLLLLGGGAALGAGGMYLWNRYNSPYEGHHPHHDPGHYYPPHQGFDPNRPQHWGGDPHGGGGHWGGDPSGPGPQHWGEPPHPGYTPQHNWGPGPDPHSWGRPNYGFDPHGQPGGGFWGDPHGGYPQGYPQGGWGHDPHGGYPHGGYPQGGWGPDPHGGFHPFRNTDFWNGSHFVFGDNTVGHGEFGNGFMPFSMGYRTAGCGNGQFCAQSNNKAGMFKADIHGTYKFPTCPNDEDCDSVIDSQDMCIRTLPRPKSYSADAWVWKDGPYAGCAAGQVRNIGDKDRDGVADEFDRCPNTAPYTTVAPSSKYMGCSTRQSPELRNFVMNTIKIYKQIIVNKKLQPQKKDDASDQLTE